jgi:hypothetical protein
MQPTKYISTFTQFVINETNGISKRLLEDNASINIICIAKCPDKEEEDIKKVKSCKKVASAGSTHSGCRRTSDSKFSEASNHTIPVELSTGVI